MADSKVTITQGTGTDIDTRTNAEGEHRQVIVIGDPSATAGVAPVHSSYGLSVDVRNIASSITVPVSATDLDIRNLSSTSDSVKVEGGNTSDVKVTLDNERVDVQRVHNVVDGTINIGDISKGTQTNDVKITLDGERPDIQRVHNLVDGTVTVQDGGNSITVDGTVTANAGSGTMAVQFSPSEPTVKVKTGETIAVYFSPSNPSVNATFSGSISAVPETGSGDSIYDETKNALVVTPHSEGTMAVYFSPSNPSVNATFSGSIEAVPVTGSGTKLYDDSVDALKICDGGNKISIDDGGSSITVDGGVDVNNRPDVNRVFNVIDGTISIGDISKGTQTNDVKITLDGERVDVQRVFNLVDGTVSVGNTVTVSATDLDIRDLSKTQDSVQIWANTAKDGSGTNYIPLVDADGHLQVDVLSGGGGGTQYTEGDTDTTITGTAMMGEGGSDTLYPLQLDASKNLKVAQQGTVDVQATDLDIRDLSSTTDSVKVEGGNTNDVKVSLDGERIDVQRVYNVVDGTMSVSNTVDVQATDLDIRNLSSSTDSVKVEGGNTNDVKITLDGERADIQRVFNVVDGTISIGSALPAGSNNIGDVDIASAIPAGDNTIGRVKLTDGTEVASVNASNQLEVAVGNTVSIQDGGNVISVDDGGSSLTVDGTVTANAGSGTMAVQFSPSEPTVQVKDLFATSIIPSVVSGSTTAVSQEGGVIVSPETGHNIKVYAFSLTSTTSAGVVVKFTDGANEKWRYKLLAPSGGMAGANLAVTPPGYLFATGTGNTLCIVLDSAEETHYSVSYFKESG